MSSLLLLGLLVLWWVMKYRRVQNLLDLKGLFLIQLEPSVDPGHYFGQGWSTPFVDIPFVLLIPFIMLGVAGATISNMLSKQSFIVPTSATTRFYAYHLLVKPLLGGFAALFLLLIESSDLLLSVVLQIEGSQKVSRAAVQIPVYSIQSAVFTLAMLSLAVGFFADRFFSSMMDKLHGILFKKSEKRQPSVPFLAGAPPLQMPSSKRDQHDEAS